MKFQNKHSKFHIYARLCVILYIYSINLRSFQRWREFEFACVEDIRFLQAPAFPRCSKFKSFYYIVTSRLQQKVFFSVFSLREAQGKRRKMRVHSGMS